MTNISHQKGQPEDYLSKLGGDMLLLMEEILHQFSLVVYPVIYDGLYTCQVVVSDFFHQQ